MRALARISYLYPWRILAAAFVVLVLAIVLAAGIFDRVDPFDISDPDSENVQASAAVIEGTGRSAEPEVLLLISSPAKQVDPSTYRGAARVLRSVPGISKVTTAASNPSLISDDGTSALVVGYLGPDAGRVEVGEAVGERFPPESGVLAGGTAVAAYQVGDRSENDARRIELYAAPILFLLLLVVFRTLGGAMLPLIVAGFSILLTLASLRLLTEVTPIDLFSLQVVTGLGTGLAIDYSLFVLSRYREEVARGRGYERAQVEMFRSAGRTVAFSSITVGTALISLVVFPQTFLHSTGIAGALTALFAGAATLLVLPAMLAILGPSVDSLSVRRDRWRTGSASTGGFWAGLSRLVCRRPVPAILAGAAVMLAMSSAGLGGRLITPDARELPREDSARVVAEATAGFSDLPPTQLFAVVPSADDSQGAAADVQALDGVTGVSERRLSSDWRTLDILAPVDPLSESGQTLVSDIREALPPGSLLGGRAAELVDQRASIADHAPEAIAIVVVTHLLLLAAMTGSALLPPLALVLNLLTVTASLGLMTATFSSDWSAGLFGTEAQAGIDISVPVLAFAVIFGLSTDYGIFLLARIREARESAANDAEAIVAGVSVTGRLISASAVLFATAVGAFAFSDLALIKEFAVAIAIAVLLDSTVVRGLLVPATLRLLGYAAWWPSKRAGSAAGAPARSEWQAAG